MVGAMAFGRSTPPARPPCPIIVTGGRWRRRHPIRVTFSPSRRLIKEAKEWEVARE